MTSGITKKHSMKPRCENTAVLLPAVTMSTGGGGAYGPHAIPSHQRRARPSLYQPGGVGPFIVPARPSLGSGRLDEVDVGIQIVVPVAVPHAGDPPEAEAERGERDHGQQPVRDQLGGPLLLLVVPDGGRPTDGTARPPSGGTAAGRPGCCGVSWVRRGPAGCAGRAPRARSGSTRRSRPAGTAPPSSRRSRPVPRCRRRAAPS